jgi:Fic family protein
MPEPNVSHEWDLITDLPADWRTFARPDLDATLRLWNGERQSLRDQTKVDRLQERLATLWAIETGVIERLYTIDRGTTETLVELGLEAIQQFSTAGSLTRDAVKLIEDQRAALDFVFAYIKEQRALSISNVKELHQLLLAHQDTAEAIDQFGNRFRASLIKGDWKRRSNNPLTPDGTIHESCPPDFVQDEMDVLVRLHLEHEEQGVRPEVEAAWLHHRFTQIHPFQDGNGRVARTLATLVFLKAGFLPLVIRDAEHRDSYLQALNDADHGDLSPLVSLFSNIQTVDLENAITYVREMRGEGIHELASAAANAIKRRMVEDEEAIEAVTEELFTHTHNRLEEISFELGQTFADAGITLDASVTLSRSDTQRYWSQQIISAAKQYKYFADLGRSRRWIQMRLNVPSVNMPRWYIVVSFHHKEQRAGLMAAVVFLTTSEADLEDTRPVILGAGNEFTYSSTSRQSTEEFRSWLDDALQRVLEIWQSRV